MKVRFFICNHCENIITMIKKLGVPIKYCGESMQETTVGTIEGAYEKHIPIYY